MSKIKTICEISLTTTILLNFYKSIILSNGDFDLNRILSHNIHKHGFLVYPETTITY